MSEREERQLYTLAEFFALVGEKRMELYEGVPVLMAPASYEHEGVVANLIGEIKLALKGSPCFVFGSNLQVVFLFQDEQKGKKNVTVLPDISVVCEKEKLRNKRCYGAPDLVVEVLSPSTARNDRLLKRYYYEKAGVKEYWIVDYQHQTIEKYVLRADDLRLEEVCDAQNDSFVSTVFPMITFSTRDIFSFHNS